MIKCADEVMGKISPVTQYNFLVCSNKKKENFIYEKMFPMLLLVYDCSNFSVLQHMGEKR